MQILVPANEVELQDALHTALKLKGPVALRYPRGGGVGLELPSTPTEWEYGKAVELKRAADQEVIILAVGRMVESAIKASELLAQQGINASVANMRWVKPLDESYLQEVASRHKLVVTLEENTVCGGFGSGVMEVLEAAEITTAVLQIGTPDAFTVQGTVKQLLEELGLDGQSVAGKISARLKKPA
jgi:1-deoxy-D-xylulose-5-phosphate synthase